MNATRLDVQLMHFFAVAAFGGDGLMQKRNGDLFMDPTACKRKILHAKGRFCMLQTSAFLYYSRHEQYFIRL
jgi:hypothetical protein